jgi:hypothetical protein
MHKTLQSIGRVLFTGERKAYVLLCTFAIVLYFRWLNFDVFSYGDWSYKYLHNVREMLSGASWITNTDYGSFNELLWRAPLDALYGLFAAAGLGINVSEKLLVFWPIAITSVLAPYILLRQLAFKQNVSILGSLFYATNTYFLSINPQGHGLLVLAGNLLTISFALFIRGIQNRRVHTFVWSALVLWLVSVTDFRLFYIGAMLLAGFVTYRWWFVRERPPILRLCLFGLITLLLQIGWLAATVVSHGGGQGDVLSRALFGGEYWDLASALTLHYPFWTDRTTSWFIVNNVPLYFWALPVAAVVSLYRNRRHIEYGFFGLVAALGVLLGKQTSPPFSWLYPFLYAHVPGFNAFRESTKFYYFVLLAYTVLITALLANLAQAKNLLGHIWGYKIAAAALLALVVLNCLPYITGSMGKLLRPATIPADYQTVTHLLQTDDSSEYRTLWVPVAPRWSYYSTLHPRLSMASLTGLPVTDQTDSQNIRSAEEMHNVLHASLFPQYLSLLSVKYVFVPLRDTANQDDFYKFYGDDRQFYIDTLDQLPFLKRVNIGTRQVAVYQNTNYRPYISATNSLYALDPSANLATAANFLGQSPGQGLNIINSPAAAKLPSKHTHSAPATPSNALTNVFDEASTVQLSKGALTRHIDLPQASQLYTAPDQPQLQYSVSGNTLSLQTITPQSGLQVDGTTIRSTAPAQNTLASMPIQADQRYYLTYGDTVLPVETKDGTHVLGHSDTPVSILSPTDDTTLANGSFETGPWQPRVSDCNPYDSHPTIGMSLPDDDPYDGNKALRLTAANHIACVNSAPMAVTASHQYMLIFRYQAPYAERISFQVNFGGKPVGGQHKTYSLDTQGGASGWRAVRQLVTVPAGATTATIQLRGLPLPNYGNLVFSAETDYDAVAFVPVRTVATANPVPTATNAFQSTLALSTGKHTIIYTSASITGRNQVPNGDLEHGLWQKQVQDCASNIDSDTPVIGMRAVSAASQGKKSLELSALKHVACTGTANIPVREGQTYQFSFDHQSSNTKSASYSISFNDSQKTTLSSYVPTGKRWQNYHTSFTAPIGATQLSIKVYARSYSGTPATSVNRYDNFQLYAVPDIGQHYYVASTPPVANAPKQLTFQIARTSKSVSVRQATSGFYLVMSEAYSPGWQATVSRAAFQAAHHAGVAAQSATPATPPAVLPHFEANAFANGWYVDPAKVCASTPTACRQNADGSYDMRLNITFAPQRVYFIGTLLSLITLAVCSVYLAVTALRRKRAPHIYRRDS